MTTPFRTAADRVAAGGDAHDEARRLVGLMTRDEVLGCLDGDTPFWPGLIDMTSGGYYRHTWPAAAVERLGIPGIEFSDGPRGCVIADATAFPVSMARGAAFDPDLEERIGGAIGAELRASGATFTGAVCMNLLRHPAWGRAQETYGEDPHHVGATAAAFTTGLQRHVMACMKHFALNSMENARFTVDVSADERALHEVYLPHFRHVAGAGVASVMSAYNSVNGAFCGENSTLLTDILRDEWGWDGMVVSDFIFGLRDAAGSVRAGLDVEMPFRQQRAWKLADALAAGELSVDDVEAAATRVVATQLRFAHVVDAAPPPTVVGCDEHRALARHASARSMVLLRNEGGLLPVDRSAIAKVAVIGRLAAVANLGDGGSSDVKASRVVTPLDGLRSAFGADTVVHSETDAGIAADADLAVVVVGYTKDDEGEYIDPIGTATLAASVFPPFDHPELGLDPDAPPATGSSATPDSGMAVGGDRTSLRLSDADEELIAAASAINDNVLVVVQSGSAVVMPWADTVPGVLMFWYPGVEGGAALADVITGAAEPGGRLPFVVPRDPAHLPHFDKDATAETYDLFHGQWKLDRDGVEPHFPFGAGLGYGDITVDGARLGRGASTLDVSVHNEGTRAGSAVVFAHAGLEASTVERPHRRLIAFGRADLAAGERTTVRLDLDWSMVDVRRDDGWWTEPGDYVVAVGLHAGDPGAIELHVERG